MNAKQVIESGKAVLGIEFGSTRIKAVLIDEENKPIAQGAHEWENQLVDGLWTYSIDAIWNGLQDCYADLRKDVKKQTHPEEPRFRPLARGEGSFPCMVGKEFPAFPSHLKWMCSPLERREELQGRATIP